MFPPGCARLATIPSATGSSTESMTIGIVVVAWWTAWPKTRLSTTITSTCRATSSAARSAPRCSLPDAQRYSMVRFSPSLQPRVRNSCKNTDCCFHSGSAGGEKLRSMPSTGTRFGGAAAGARPTSPKARMTTSPTVMRVIVVSSCRPANRLSDGAGCECRARTRGSQRIEDTRRASSSVSSLSHGWPPTTATPASSIKASQVFEKMRPFLA